jgi:hypothetical protein
MLRRGTGLQDLAIAASVSAYHAIHSGEIIAHGSDRIVQQDAAGGNARSHQAPQLVAGG